jgi:DNA-binding IclR family transcriptional regulator
MAVRGGVKPVDLAQVLGVDRSTAYRLLYTLKVKGYLDQDPTTHEFLPNPSKFFALSSEVAGPMNWSAIATSFLQVLRDRTRETANLGVLQEHEVVYVGQVQGQEALIVNHSLGTRRPLHCSALGKAILAFLPTAEAEWLIRQTQLTAKTPRTITDPQALRQHLRQVRRQGFAVDDEETFEGVRCIAAPILNHQGQVIASMGISGPSTRMTLERIATLAEIVVEAAGQTSAALGARNTATRLRNSTATAHTEA